MNRSDILDTAKGYVCADRNSQYGEPELRKVKLAYKNMISRCYDERNASFQHYGGRGIMVCAEWLTSRDVFIEWAFANDHAMHLSLERSDTNGNYGPSNCCWATLQEQLNNQRRNKILTLNGVSKTQAEWAHELGIGVDTLFRRINVYKMPLEKALTAGSLNRPWKHGTRAGYEGHKCRCDLCRASNAKRHRAYVEKRKAA